MHMGILDVRPMMGIDLEEIVSAANEVDKNLFRLGKEPSDAISKITAQQKLIKTTLLNHSGQSSKEPTIIKLEIERDF